MSAARYLVPLAIALLAACSDTTGPDLRVAQKGDGVSTPSTGTSIAGPTGPQRINNGRK
ncbi:MAG TPA: hypothetical protein VE091_00065 [Gemmatimonadales bacterium]|nr:hypothetical protein [Gemmatimonadales bacterium]